MTNSATGWPVLLQGQGKGSCVSWKGQLRHQQVEIPLLFRKNWIIANPKNTFAAFGKLPGSEGNHSQTAEHRQ